MDIQWSTNNGYTLVGSCQADGVCEEKQGLLAGDKNTVGTECCFDQNCNHPSKILVLFIIGSSLINSFQIHLNNYSFSSIYFDFSQNDCELIYHLMF